LLSFLSYAIFAQDIIFKTDGSEIKAKVLEIEQTCIKYKNVEQLDGPIRNILKSQVFMILYQDGSVDKFTTIDNLDAESMNDTTEKTKIALSNEIDYQLQKAKYLKRTGTKLIAPGVFGTIMGGMFYILSESKANQNDRTFKSISYLFMGISIPLTISGITIYCVGQSKFNELSKRKVELGFQIVPFDNFSGNTFESANGLAINMCFTF